MVTISSNVSKYISDGAINLVNSSISFVSNSIIVLVAFIYFLIDMDKIRDNVDEFFSKKSKKTYKLVQDIDHERHLHGIVGLIGRTEHGRNGEADGLEKAESAHDVHVGACVGHKVGADVHPVQHLLAKKEKTQADEAAHAGVEEQGGSDHLDETLLVFRSKIERAHHGGADRSDVEEEEYHVEQLVDYADSRHGIVGMMAQHQRIDHAKRQHQKRFQEDGTCQLKQLAPESAGATKEMDCSHTYTYLNLILKSGAKLRSFRRIRKDSKHSSRPSLRRI